MHATIQKRYWFNRWRILSLKKNGLTLLFIEEVGCSLESQILFWSVSLIWRSTGGRLTFSIMMLSADILWPWFCRSCQPSVSGYYTSTLSTKTNYKQPSDTTTQTTSTEKLNIHRTHTEANENKSKKRYSKIKWRDPEITHAALSKWDAAFKKLFFLFGCTRIKHEATSASRSLPKWIAASYGSRMKAETAENLPRTYVYPFHFFYLFWIQSPDVNDVPSCLPVWLYWEISITEVPRGM